MNDAYARYCSIRDLLGIKDAEVAKKTGIGKSTFSDWKSGRSTPKEEKMRKIAAAIGSTYDFLTTGKNDVIEEIEMSVQLHSKELFEKEMIRMFNDLSPEQKKELLDYAQWLQHKDSGKDQK